MKETTKEMLMELNERGRLNDDYDGGLMYGLFYATRASDDGEGIIFGWSVIAVSGLYLEPLKNWWGEDPESAVLHAYNSEMANL